MTTTTQPTTQCFWCKQVIDQGSAYYTVGTLGTMHTTCRLPRTQKIGYAQAAAQDKEATR